jgi:WD40 repeat protein/predicted Ser/Thr protein kinase
MNASAPAEKSCVKCGVALPADAPQGICPRCELEGALALLHGQAAPVAATQGATQDSTPLPPRRFGNYELLEEIARGGMGIVYRARQVGLDRIVALKMMLAGQFAGKQVVERFHAEAAAAAVLQHPNVVAVHDVGVEDGQHYFSMDFVEGSNLTKFVGQRPLGPSKAARYVKLIAEAVHYAHEQGILHRDLKPSNVLIDANDQPRITDFGLAKRLDGSSSLTATGQMLGTPNFMPPEQASTDRGKVGRASDVYGLGAILYFLLTARAPFQADSLEAIVTQVLNTEPISPRLLNPAVPRDLETISLKCLEKEPPRRYPTAQSLAEDLGRFLHDEPIVACPVGRAERVWRWCRRKPVIATLSATTALLLLAVTIGSPIAAFRIHREKQQALHEKEIARQHLYAADMSLAHQALEMGNLGRAIHLMERHRPKPGETDVRGFEWRYLWQHCQGDEDSTIRTTAIGVLAYSPDGQVLVSEGESKTVVREASTKKVITHLPTTARSLAFSPRNKTLVTAADQHVRLWDTENWRLLRELPGADHPAVFSSDGQWLATAGEHRLKLWDTTTWRAVSTNQTPLDFDWMSRYGMAFSPDARVLVTANRASVRFWEVPSLKELPGLEGDIGRAGSLAFSKDGKYLVTGRANGSIDVWEVRTRQKVDTLRQHNGWISVLAFSPDGQTLASASADQTIVLWSLEKRTSLATLKGHSHEVWALAYSPDNQTLASGSGDETIKFWNANARRTDEILEEAYTPLSFSPDGRTLAFAGNTSLKFYDVATKQTAEFPTLAALFTPKNDYGLFNVAISSDHRTLAVGRSNGMVELWDIPNKKRLAPAEGHPGATNVVMLSPDGKILAAARGKSPVKIWDVDSQQELATFSGPTSDISSLAFSPRGEILAVGSWRLATLWHVRSKRAVAALEGHKSFVDGLGFSPDGKLVATGSRDGTAKIWEVQTGRELVTLTGHTEGTLAVCFIPDGRTLATAGGDGRVRLWSMATYQEMASLPGQEDGNRITFSRDGNTMATGGREQDTVRIWRAPTFAEIQGTEKRQKIVESLTR